MHHGNESWFKRKRNILLLATAAMLLGCTSCVFSEFTNSRPNVRIEQLLADASVLPYIHSEGYRLSSDVNSQGDRISSNARMDVQEEIGDNIERVWRNPDGRSIRQGVWKHRDPLSARLDFFFSSPRFNDDYLSPQVVPDAYKSPTADRSEVVCGAGTIDACYTWEYWAQYGQYLIRVWYIGPNDHMGPDKRISVQKFVEYLAPIDSYVGEQLADN